MELSMTTVEGWISRLPGGAALVRQERKKHIQGRAEHVEAIAKIRADQAHQDGALAKREADAHAAVEAAKKKLVEVTGVLTGVRAERQSARFTAEHAQRQHEIVLRETADNERIFAFRSELCAIQERLRGSLKAHGDTVREGGVASHVEFVTNAEGVKRCLAAVLAAREACERLRVEAYEDLDVAIEAIRRTIPLADLELTETFVMQLGYNVIPWDRAAEARKYIDARAQDATRAS